MVSAAFADHPKLLPNDVTWITNLPYEKVKATGRYFKPDAFLRLPFAQILREVAPDIKHLNSQALAIGQAVAYLSSRKEAVCLRESNSLSAAILEAFDLNVAEHADWEAIGTEALTRHWQGSNKNRMLISGSLMAQRFPYALQLIKMPVLDLSHPPKIIKSRLSGPALESALKESFGFVRMRVEHVAKDIQEFVSLDRTLWTTTEALWLSRRATVTVSMMYLANGILNHPVIDKIGHDFDKHFHPLSWVDSLRVGGAYMAPGIGRPATEAWLRGNSHIAMAFWAEWLTSKKGVSCISLSAGKIGVSYSSKESQRVLQAARSGGLMTIMGDPDDRTRRQGKANLQMGMSV